ncbi:MAG: V-type ATP synthase subunit I [bacterium]
MFKYSQMTRLDIAMPEHSLNTAITHIAHSKILHLMNIQKNSPGETDRSTKEQDALERRYQLLEENLRFISERLSIKPGEITGPALTLNPEDEVESCEEMIKEISEQITSFLEEHEAIAQKKAMIQKCIHQLTLFAFTNIEISYFVEHEFLYATAGFIPQENLDRLKHTLSNLYHVLIQDEHIGNRRLIIILCSIRDREKLDKILNSAYVEKIAFPEHIHGTNLQQVIEDLSYQICKLDEREKELEEKFSGIGAVIQSQLSSLIHKVLTFKSILKIKKYCNKVGHTYHLSAWVPTNRIAEFEKNINEATHYALQIHKLSGNEPDKDVENSFLKPPTSFKNPPLIKPFENLILNYGIPGYKEIDPTFFFAISFLIMFGVMFGDVGHGLVLFILGLFAWKSSSSQIKEVSAIVMECGVSSMLFGFLYGSIFGFENWLIPLWFNPMDDIYRFMKVTIVFGIIMISLAVVFNIINSIKNKDYLTGLFGEFGLMGFLFYWGCIGICLIYLCKGTITLRVDYALAIIGTPLIVIFFKEPLHNLLFRRNEGHILPEDIGLYLMESFIEVIDTIIGFLSSTVSFIRVCAFALAHAGLFMAVFSLANSLHQMKGGAFFYVLTMVIGNILIIALEGLVVSIQTIRLEYYEFFSKFFKGDGERYTPLEIK